VESKHRALDLSDTHGDFIGICAVSPPAGRALALCSQKAKRLYRFVGSKPFFSKTSHRHSGPLSWSAIHFFHALHSFIHLSRMSRSRFGSDLFKFTAKTLQRRTNTKTECTVSPL
jgi:hypothetical protein